MFPVADGIDSGREAPNAEERRGVPASARFDHARPRANHGEGANQKKAAPKSGLEVLGEDA